LPDFLTSSNALKAHVGEILSFLETARPTAVNLSAATTRLARTLHSLSQETDIKFVARQLIAEGWEIANEDIGRNIEMSKHGAEWLLQHYQHSKGDDLRLNVLTVCNTGSLATSVGYHRKRLMSYPLLITVRHRDMAQRWA
jgi:methylthioribose-1-phosphate isomerase